MRLILAMFLSFLGSFALADDYTPPACVVDGYDVPIFNTAHYVFPSGKTKDSFVAESFLGEDGKPIIMYNGAELLKHFSPETVTFIVRHECQHVILGHLMPVDMPAIAPELHRQHEVQADCEAAREILGKYHFTNTQLLNVIEDVRVFVGGPPAGRSGEETSEIIEICTGHFTNIDGCGMPVSNDELRAIGHGLEGVQNLDAIMPPRE